MSSIRRQLLTGLGSMYTWTTSAQCKRALKGLSLVQGLPCIRHWRALGPQTGVLSAAKKRVVAAEVAQELGAELQGNAGTIGPSGLRVLKLIQCTLVTLAKKRLKHKWVQVVAGRWVHCMSFRRPTMTCLDVTWSYVAGKVGGPAAEARVRAELFGCCCIALLMHGNLKAGPSQVTTASDASSTGGAVGKSDGLTLAGSQFAGADRANLSGGRTLPILVVSLFNGIGCCFRCYDLLGVTPMVAISYETNAAANRVTSRRWPHVQLEKDVRDLTIQVIRQWRYLYPALEEIHVWGGFPCVGLSSVRSGRLNLDDPQSGLFWEFVRIVKEIKQVFGIRFRVLYAAENVASMDVSAEAEISRALDVKPYKLDPAGAVPIHRPRFCWSNMDLAPMEGVDVEEKDRWWEVRIQNEYPKLEQWLEEGAQWPGFSNGTILPTCMKCIKRSRPPPAPAGIDRVGYDGKMRWIADDFRFPPYQYDDRFIVWVGSKWRLINASERELLHGLGFEHTSLCWSAGDIKNDPQGFEDQRKTLVGDSFSCYSFVFIAAQLCNRWMTLPSYSQLADRMGMAPGFCCPLAVKIPLQRGLSYSSECTILPVQCLHSALLRRVNHTGSDVRISSGTLMNPRNFPRQSAAAGWWNWAKVFSCRWSRFDHINNLEVRSIIHAIEWRVKHLKECHLRVFHLTDSYIGMSVISKGRSSSQMLKPLLARLAALLLALDIYLIVSHVDSSSSENPTDHASRA